MKRAVISLLIAGLFLYSCANTDEPTPSDFGEDHVPVSVNWETEKGTYFTSTPLFLEGIMPGFNPRPEDYDEFEGDPLLLYINDAASGNNIILCNRPGCEHDSLDCNAYLPYDSYSEPGRSRDIRRTSVVFVDGGYVYAHNAGSRIFRFNLDGTERTEAVKLPSRYYGLTDGWLMNGKLYTHAYSYHTTGDFDVGIIIANVLIEIDYLNGEVRELWVENQEENKYASIFAINNGVFYGIERLEPFRFRGVFANDEEKLDYHTNIEYTLFSVNPDDDEAQVNNIRTGRGYEFNPYLVIYPAGDNPGVYYHSRRDEAVFLLDLVTGESVRGIENIPGTMQITGLFGGRLFMSDFMQENETGFRVYDDVHTGFLHYDETGKMHGALFFVDMATGEITQSTIITKRTAFCAILFTEGGYTGNTDGFTDIIYEDNGYFYIEIERQEKEVDIWGNRRSINIYLYRFLIGRIPIEDYWSGNANAIEELGWIDLEEYLKLRSKA